MQHVNTMKTKFLEMWDGLATARAQLDAAPAGAAGAAAPEPRRDWVLVIGATNKPWALDPAALRRMPRQVFVGLPDAGARAAILRVLLRRERAAASIAAELPRVAEAAEGYSGSDLKELVRAAALIPIREEIQAQRRAAKAAKAAGASSAGAGGAPENATRPLVAADLLAALESVKPTGVAAAEYRFAQAAGATGVSFAADVPAYMPSASLRLNTKSLTSQIEGSTVRPAGLGAEKRAALAPAAAAPASAAPAGAGNGI